MKALPLVLFCLISCQAMTPEEKVQAREQTAVVLKQASETAAGFGPIGLVISGLLGLAAGALAPRSTKKEEKVL